MTADLPRPQELPKGNGARAALIAVAESLPRTDRNDAERWADWLLMEPWSRGFKVVPLE